MKYATLVIFLLLLFACQKTTTPNISDYKVYDEEEYVVESKKNTSIQLQFNRFQSLATDKNETLAVIRPQLAGFSEELYERLTPYIYERNIIEIQQAISDKKLTYKLLTQWYLYRIASIDMQASTSLNAIISINPNAVYEAELLDKKRIKGIPNQLIFGMPILLKDNINTAFLPTTAGAVYLQNFYPKVNASIVSILQAKNAIILGKVNLSEWANFMCIGCPNGYSGIGGQTLNPYGPRKFDTGGSSSGSAVAVASNFAVAAIGTETSGSILSPSSQNSVVGLKPGFGVLSKEGIIPISNTLDTPGPITKNTIDNAIVLASLKSDFSKKNQELQHLKDLSGLRLGVVKAFLQDETFNMTIKSLRKKDIQLVEIDPTPINFSGFLELLSGEMKSDLETYFKTYGERQLTLVGIENIMNFNSKDSLTNIPYNQGLFDGIANLNLQEEELDEIRMQLLSQGKKYFDEAFEAEALDVIISMNNYTAGQAALAGYPAITVPMGYDTKGEPKGITFIGKSNTEEKLLAIAHYFETHFPKRVPPKF